MDIDYSLEPTSGPTTVNATTTGNQTSPAMAMAANGSGVVFFTNGGALVGRRLDTSGAPVGPEVSVGVSTAFTPKAVALKNGNFVVVWLADSDVMAQVYTPGLTRVGSAVKLFDGDASRYFFRTDVAATPDGGFVAVADKYYASDDYDIHLKTFSATGAELKHAYLSSSGTRDLNGEVTVLKNGDIAVAHTREISSEYQTWSAIYSTKSTDTSLTEVKAPFAVTALTSQSDYDVPWDLVSTPANGGYAIVKSVDNHSFSTTYRYPQIINVSADGVVGNSPYFGPAGGNPYSADVSAAGRTVVASVSNSRITLTFGKDYPEAYIDLGSSGTQFSPLVKWINNYTVQVTFASTSGYGSEGNSTGIATARYELVKTWQGYSSGEVMKGEEIIDVMFGGAGNDTLNGGGGPDTMHGGADSDTYYVDDAHDVVDEAGSTGNDVVIASVSFKLPYAVERLSLSGSKAINGTGNELNNSITGNSAANRIDGSFGADLMKGMGGNDSYVVDNVGDVVNEIDPGSNGIDTVYASIDYRLGSSLERLVLTGSLKLDGSGNGLANYIQGNGKANVLKGGGNNDTIKGGGGKDTIDGSSGKDIADYSDKTKAVVATLNGSHTATVKIGGNGEDKIKNIEGLTGGSKADTLTGDSKANVLNGGLGKDTLKGESGSDQFVFSTALSKSNADKIADFKHDTDKIVLDDAIFKAIGAKLDKAEFYAKSGATSAHDGNDHVIYDKSSGKLYYDSDGKGGHGAVLFATLSGHPSLDHGDFLIV
jgi:Ca2+-binding RTX toxin-like protein